MERKKLFSEIPQLQSGRIVIRPLDASDARSLEKLTGSEAVYRYLPTFLFEKKYPDAATVIDRLYGECFKESIIEGVFAGGAFSGLCEFYGWRDDIHKISVGYRLLEDAWGKGIATETLGLMIRYLLDETDIEIITASTMAENRASANVLMKNGFALVASGVPEDWGYDEPIPTDKWIR